MLTSSVILPASAGPLVSRPCVPKAVTPRLIAASLRAVHLAPVAVRADVRHLLAATAVKTTAIRVKFVHGRYPAWTSFTASAILVPAGFVPGRRGSFFFSGMAPPLIFPQSHQPTSRTRATMIPPRFLSLLFQTPECRGFYPPTTPAPTVPTERRERRVPTIMFRLSGECMVHPFESIARRKQSTGCGRCGSTGAGRARFRCRGSTRRRPARVPLPRSRPPSAADPDSLPGCGPVHFEEFRRCAACRIPHRRDRPPPEHRR